MNIKNLLNQHHIKNVTSNLQDADASTAVFYFVHEGKEDVFKDRLKSSNPGLLFLNKNIEGVKIPHVVVENFYDVQTDVCDALYPDSHKVKIIGVTGTNGKSTCVHLCSEILNYNGIKSFTVGTLGVMCGEDEILSNPGATTPSYLDLRRITNELSDYEYMCLEVSSHALSQDRLKGFNIEVAGWTNLTQDHLDYHGDMQSYFEAKKKISEKTDELFVVASQDNLLKMLDDSKTKYTISKSISFNVENPALKLRYNEDNLALSYDLCCSATKKELNIPEDISLPKGRFTSFKNGNDYFVVDYAHTPDAIEKLAAETREVLKDYMVVTVFGCGGDRDRTKRPLMLKAALENSDEVIVTSDNPRTEDPQQIINDIIGDVHENIVSFVDRAQAITHAVRKYEHKTVVLIAGKGHEEYQDIAGEKRFFSDIALVEELVGKLKNES